MTSNNVEKLFDMKNKLGNIKADFKENALSKGRYGSLVLTKFDEIQHWLNDLVGEAIQDEEKNVEDNTK